jgi:hypothetical protein
MARAIEHHLVGPVMQKRRAAFHRLQDPVIAFDAQRLRRNPLPFGDPAHQRSGLMDSQIVEHEMPLPRLLIAGKQPLDVDDGTQSGSDIIGYIGD